MELYPWIEGSIMQPPEKSWEINEVIPEHRTCNYRVTSEFVFIFPFSFCWLRRLCSWIPQS